MRRPGIALAALAGLVLCASASLSAATLAQPDFALDYDSSDWRMIPAAPPAELALACVATDCPADAMVIVVAGPSVPGFGAGAFTPGAASAATIDLLAQALAPGTRLLALHPAEPMPIGDLHGYRAVYDVEHGDLTRTQMIEVIMPRPGASIHVRLAAVRLSPALTQRFDRLLRGFRFGSGKP